MQQLVQIEESRAKFGAAYLEHSGTVYPRKLVRLLLRTALGRMKNLSIHPYCPVTSVLFDSETPDSHAYTVSTGNGSIRSRSILHATNGYASHLLPSLRGEDGVYGCRAHMLAVQPNTLNDAKIQLKQGFGYEDFQHWILQRPNGGPFLYGLGHAETDHEYDDTVTLDPDHPVRKDMLDFLEKTFPQYFQNLDISKDVTYDWTGIQGFTDKGASIVGRPTLERPGEFVSVGFNGEGMNRCFVCAIVVIDGLISYLENDKEWSPPDWFPNAWRRNL